MSQEHDFFTKKTNQPVTPHRSQRETGHKKGFAVELIAPSDFPMCFPCGLSAPVASAVFWVVTWWPVPLCGLSDLPSPFPVHPPRAGAAQAGVVRLRRQWRPEE